MRLRWGPRWLSCLHRRLSCLHEPVHWDLRSSQVRLLPRRLLATLRPLQPPDVLRIRIRTLPGAVIGTTARTGPSTADAGFLSPPRRLPKRRHHPPRLRRRRAMTISSPGCPFSCPVSSPRLRRRSQWKRHRRNQAPMPTDRARRHKPSRQSLQDAARRCGESNPTWRRHRQRPARPSGMIRRNRMPATSDSPRRSTRPNASHSSRTSSSGNWTGTCSAARDGTQAALR
jgi:hypothetical protein